MAHKGVILPVLQNWSCHNCGGCCREHQIGITEEEKRRIEKQGWTEADGIPTDRPLIIPLGTAWRLNHRDEGCVAFMQSLANQPSRWHARSTRMPFIRRERP